MAALGAIGAGGSVNAGIQPTFAPNDHSELQHAMVVVSVGAQERLITQVGLDAGMLPPAGSVAVPFQVTGTISAPISTIIGTVG